jgi:hypothetical protein
MRGLLCGCFRIWHSPVDDDVGRRPTGVSGSDKPRQRRRHGEPDAVGLLK